MSKIADSNKMMGVKQKADVNEFAIKKGPARNNSMLPTIVLLLIVICTPLLTMKHIDKTRTAVQSHEGDAQEIISEAEIHRIVQAIIANADAEKIRKTQNAVLVFEKQLDNAVVSLIKSGPLVDDTVNQLTTYKETLKLASYMVFDKISGNAAADGIIQDAIKPLLVMGDEAQGIVLKALNDLNMRLEQIYYEHSETILNEIKIIEGSTYIPQEYTAAYHNKFNAAREIVKPISIETTIGTGTIALTAIFSRDTIIKFVRRGAQKSLGKTVQKTASRMTMAAAPAVVDGPAPFLDAITVALEAAIIAWSAYDIYHAQVVLKKELHVELTNAVGSMAKDIKKNARDLQNMLLETYQQSYENKEKGV